MVFRIVFLKKKLYIFLALNRFYFVFLDCFDVLMSKINFKNKKNNIFPSKKYFKK